ncbi:P2Y purinoceptor 12 isoform X3 [Rhineura floridana]|uniref:P2Y purinoceptor 12 isoform X3 n=1 Tax=Rhineura floridana TaxID=261503 RepID=UPI002AC85A4B|nr:P2Y purinoceptor 12 isoform X3 [Rhineura floridana]
MGLHRQRLKAWRYCKVCIFKITPGSPNLLVGWRGQVRKRQLHCVRGNQQSYSIRRNHMCLNFILCPSYNSLTARYIPQDNPNMRILQLISVPLVTPSTLVLKDTGSSAIDIQKCYLANLHWKMSARIY